MTEEPSNVATALVRRLETGAELVDRGLFTLDFAKAREKLAEYRLANPNAFVLLLVEVAHLLSGCSEIAFSITHAQTRVRLEGAGLSEQELQSLFDVVLANLEARDPETRRRELGRQRLALAIDAASSQLGTSVELRAISTDAREVTVKFGSEGPVVEELGASTSPPSLEFVFDHSRDGQLDDIGAQQRDLLVQQARYAKLPVILDGKRVDQATPLADVIEPVDVRGATDELLGRAGWSTARADAVAMLVANGVIIEELHESDWQPGFVALVDVEDLRRDLSLAKLVRDNAFLARVAAIRAVHDGLPTNRMSAVSHASLADRKWEHLILGVGMLVILGILLYGMGEFLLLVILAVSGLGLIAFVQLRHFVTMQRESFARQGGLRAVGMIESMHLVQDKDKKVLRLGLAVSIPDREPFRAALEQPVMGEEAEQFKPGARFHMRVDSENPRRVWLDSPTRSSP